LPRVASGGQVLQGEGRLAASRKAEGHRRGPREQAAAEHFVELRHPDGHPRLALALHVRIEHIFHAWVHDEARRGDVDLVAAQHVPGPAELDDLDRAIRAARGALEGQLDEAIHHRVLGAVGVRRRHVGKQHRGAVRHAPEHLELDDELLERRVAFRHGARRGDAVEHEERGLFVLDHAPQHVEQTLEPLVA